MIQAVEPSKPKRKKEIKAISPSAYKAGDIVLSVFN